MARRKTQLCRDVLKSSSIVETGIAARKGIASYDLASALMLQVQKEGKKFSEKEAMLSEAMGLLERCVDVLAIEPPGTSYHTLLETAKKELMQLKMARK